MADVIFDDGSMPAEANDAPDWDRAAHVLLAGFVASLIVAILLNFTASNAIQYAATASTQRIGFAAQLLLVVAGLVTIFDPPGFVCDRNIKIAAFTLLATPFLANAALLGDGESALYVKLAGLESLATGTAPAAIFAIVAIRHRHRMNGSPLLAVAGILVSIPFRASLSFATYLEYTGESTAIALGLASLGSMVAPMAALLAMLAKHKSHLLSLLRSFLIVGVVASATALVLNLSSETSDDRFEIGSPLPRSILVLTILAVVLTALRPTVQNEKVRKAPISVGWTIVSAIVFWPIGIVAVSLAARSLAAAESADYRLSDRLADQAGAWRASAFAVGLIIYGLVYSQLS